MALFGVIGWAGLILGGLLAFFADGVLSVILKSLALLMGMIGVFGILIIVASMLLDRYEEALMDLSLIQKVYPYKTAMAHKEARSNWAFVKNKTRNGLNTANVDMVSEALSELEETLNESLYQNEDNFNIVTRKKLKSLEKKADKKKKEVAHYINSGQLARELKTELCVAYGLNISKPLDQREVLAVITGWFAHHGPAGAYIRHNKIASDKNENYHLVRGEMWEMEIVARMQVWERFNEEVGFLHVELEGGEDYEMIKMLWEPDPSMYLHHPERVVKAARKLQKASRV